MAKQQDSAPLGDLYEPNCPGREILDHVVSRWGALALIVLRRRRYRFNELRRHIGNVSDKMLAQTLRTLEDDGFVERHDFREVPPRVAYSLTPLGREVARHVAALGKWVGDHAPAIVAAREQRRRSNPKRRARSTQVSTASREQPVSIAVTTR